MRMKKGYSTKASRGKRAKERKVVAHLSHNWEEAEAWDLAYWLGQTPEKRIDALETLRRDLANIGKCT